MILLLSVCTCLDEAKKCLLVLQSLAISEPSGSCLPIIQMLKAFNKGTKGTSNDMQMGFGTKGQKVYQTSPFSWPMWMRTQFFLDFLLSVAPSLFCIPAGVVPAVPAISKQYSRNIYQLQTVLSVDTVKASQLASTCTGTLLQSAVIRNFLPTRTPDLFC